MHVATKQVQARWFPHQTLKKSQQQREPINDSKQRPVSKGGATCVAVTLRSLCHSIVRDSRVRCEGQTTGGAVTVLCGVGIPIVVSLGHVPPENAG